MLGPKQQSKIQFLKQLTLMLAMRLDLKIFKTVAKTAVLRNVIDRP